MAISGIRKSYYAVKNSKLGQYVNKNYNHVALQFVNVTSSIANGIGFGSVTVGSLSKFAVDAGECFEKRRIPTIDEAPFNGFSYIGAGARKIKEIMIKGNK